LGDCFVAVLLAMTSVPVIASEAKQSLGDCYVATLAMTSN
jgi:hypothetical protein